MSACHARIAALESELTAATAEHNNRLAQQQKAFLAKLEQLRQVHNQQVAAAIKEAQVCVCVCHVSAATLSMRRFMDGSKSSRAVALTVEARLHGAAALQSCMTCMC